MAFMRRDVNVGLLLIIVAALIMFSGFTVYYQTTFKNVSQTYQKELSELEKVTNDLESKRNLLNETSTQLQIRQQKEDELSKKFVDTKSERDTLESDKKKLEVQLASAQAQLKSANAQLSDAQSKLAQQTQLVAQLNQQVNSLKARIDNLEEEKDCLEQTSGQSENC